MLLLVYRHTIWWRSKDRPVARPYDLRDGSSAPGERKTRERGSPVCSTRDQVHLSDERGCRTAGCERGFMPWQFATRLRKARDRSAADTVRIDAGEMAYDLNACAGSEVALGESRLRGSQASLNSDCQKQAKAIFIFNNAAR